MTRRSSLALCLLLALFAAMPQVAASTQRNVMQPTVDPLPGSIDDGFTLQESAELDAEQLDAMVATPDGGWAQGLAPVIQFLQLAPPQVEALVQLLVQRQQAAAPLAEQIAQRRAALAELLQQGAPPALVGQLVIQINQLQGAIAAIQAEFLEAVHDILLPMQQQKLQAIQLAATLRPLVPAFLGLGLI